jgi:hypothetical protein
MAAMAALAPPGSSSVNVMQQQALMAAALAFEAQRHGISLPLPQPALFGAMQQQQQQQFQQSSSAAALNARLSTLSSGSGSSSGGAPPVPPMSLRRSRVARARSAGAGRSSVGPFSSSSSAGAPPPPPPTTPGGGYVDPAQFQDRVARWAQDKRAETERKAREESDRMLKECTFRPEINEASKHLLKSSRSYNNGASDSIHERLFKQAKTPSARAPGSRGQSSSPTAGAPSSSPMDPECVYKSTLCPLPPFPPHTHCPATLQAPIPLHAHTHSFHPHAHAPPRPRKTHTHTHTHTISSPTPGAPLPPSLLPAPMTLPTPCGRGTLTPPPRAPQPLPPRTLPWAPLQTASAPSSPA